MMTYSAAIEKHLTQIWSQPLERIRVSRGPIHELPVDFHVLVMHRLPEFLVYATRCMSQPSDKVRLELFVFTRNEFEGDPKDGLGLAELLTAVAHYHRTGAHLGLHHTVNFGQPWLEGSECEHGLLSLPYLDPDVEWLEQEEMETRFLWLIPITTSELEFKKQRGVEALEQQFEEAEFDFADPFRSSVV